MFGGLGVDDRCAMEPNIGVVQNLGVAILMGTLITRYSYDTIIYINHWILV